jgi:ribosomal protein S18 acetylase RimI-like enzyme
MGSLGIGRLAWPKPSSKLVAASSIPMLGVDARFQGKGFGGQILSDLVATALLEAHIRPQLVLYVHESNVRGLDFYRKHNFIEHGKPWLDRSTGWLNKRMVLDFGSVTTG